MLKWKIVMFCFWIGVTLNLSGEQKSGSLKKGDRSPEFRAQGVDGKEVTLKSLKGRYVYIDIWATWCEPCINEIPFMKSLEKKFRKKRIAFVSISSEKNRGKWAEMLRIEEMTGIQLNTGGDKSFMEAYGVEGIPRFILLDKKGRILEMDMTRPSDPETEKKLLRLKGIS